MVDGCLEEDGRRRIRVVGREREAQLEREAGIRGVLRSLDSGGPRHEVAISGGKRGDSGRWRGHKGHQLGLESIENVFSTFIKLISSLEDDVPFGDALRVWALASGIELGGLDAAGGGVLVILGVIHCKQKTGSSDDDILRESGQRSELLEMKKKKLVQITRVEKSRLEKKKMM